MLSVEFHQIVAIRAFSSMRDNGPSETRTSFPSDQPRYRVKFRLASVRNSTHVVIEKHSTGYASVSISRAGLLERQGARRTGEVPADQTSTLPRLPAQTPSFTCLLHCLQKQQQQQQQQQQHQQQGHALTAAWLTAADSDPPPPPLPRSISRPPCLRRRNPIGGR